MSRPVVYIRGMTDALVIFEHNNMHPLSPLLKRGYRHVWCAVIDERAHAWVGHDLRLAGHQTTVLCDVGYPIATHYREQGKEVIEITRKDFRAPGPFILNNCVGLTKTVCGIRSLALTPWQLRQHLLRISSGGQEWHDFSIT